jgi:hypothetical protein
MPEICRFYGIIIKMYFDDHLPPHFHAEYGDDEILLNIETLSIVAGRLPHRAMGLVREWALLHRDELKEAWEKAKNLEQPRRIDPLP